MSNEISVNGSVVLRKGSLNDNIPFTNLVDMDTDDPKGPVPGAISITTVGVEIDVSQLTTPGVGVWFNLDDENYFEWGIKEPENNRFYMIGEVGPGEAWPFQFSRNLLEDYGGTGTGTTPPTNKLWARANGATVYGGLKAYEK